MYHLLGELDRAIVKYHEVCILDSYLLIHLSRRRAILAILPLPLRCAAHFLPLRFYFSDPRLTSIYSSVTHSFQPQALSIDPINPHILDLLNIALESGTVTGPGGKVVDAEFKKTIRLLKGKYGRVKEGKGKEREREGKHADEEKGADEMSIG